MAPTLRIEQVGVSLRCAVGRHQIGIEPDAGIGLPNHNPVVRSFDRVGIVSAHLRRLERLQDVFVTRHHQAVGGKLERIDLVVARPIFLKHLARRFGRAAAHQLDFDVGIFLLEAVEQRLDLRAGGVEQQACFAPRAVFEDLLTIGAGVVGDRFHAIGSCRP
jgi:hypothetical protein